MIPHQQELENAGKILNGQKRNDISDRRGLLQMLDPKYYEIVSLEVYKIGLVKSVAKIRTHWDWKKTSPSLRQI